jgi:hypothetical protein
MFVASAPGPISTQEMEPGVPMTWWTTQKMGVIYRIEADEKFGLQCGPDPAHAVTFASKNLSGKWDVCVPTGIPIAWSLLRPLQPYFKDNAQLPYTVYGHRWANFASPDDFPVIPRCVVPVHRNYIDVNSVLMMPLHPMRVETMTGF